MTAAEQAITRIRFLRSFAGYHLEQAAYADAEADRQEQQLVDELMADVEQLPSGRLSCCQGYGGEHFDHCPVGADIAQARRRIAQSNVPAFPKDDER